MAIATGVKIMNHFIAPAASKDDYTEGSVHIGDNVFFGMNDAIIVKPINIGDGALIAAGAVISSDVPSNAIFGGVSGKPIGWVSV